MEKKQNNITYRVLNIDGGGIRGIIPLFYLDLLEKISGKKVWELFDFFSGTSIGGIISLLFSQRLYSAEQLLSLFLGQLKNKVFPSKRYFSFLLSQKPLYDPDIMEEVSKELFGDILFTEAKGNFLITGSKFDKDECATPFIFVKDGDKSETYSITMNPIEQDFFKYEKCDIVPKDFMIRHLARITSSAYPLFSISDKIPGFNFLDGGFTYNNPSYLTLKYLEEIKGINTKEIFMLSLGTALDIHTVKLNLNYLNESLLKFRPVLLSSTAVLYDGMDNLAYMQILLCDSILKERHIRISPDEMEVINLDEVDKISIGKLKRAAQKMVIRHRKLSGKIFEYLNVQETNQFKLYNEKSLYYYYPKYYIYKDFYSDLDKEINGLELGDDRPTMEAIFEKFEFPYICAIDKVVKDLVSKTYYESVSRMFISNTHILPLLALCIGHLKVLSFCKNEIDPFEFFNGYNLFHYAAANDEAAGLLILLEEKFLEPGTIDMNSNCKTFVLKKNLNQTDHEKLIRVFLSDDTKTYTEKESLENINTPLGVAMSHFSSDVINLYKKILKFYSNRFGEFKNEII